LPPAEAATRFTALLVSIRSSGSAGEVGTASAPVG
jgi:hypothetical protein